MAVRIAIIAAVSAATILTAAAPARADDTPDYSAFLNDVKAAGKTPANDGKLVAMGNLICDSLRSGEAPLDVDKDVRQGLPGISEAQRVLLVHAAQDNLCPDTEAPPAPVWIPPALPPGGGGAAA
jgi:hypothetical protein